MATKTEIATKVLQKLTVLEADETPSTEDLTLVESKYDSVYPLLKSEDLVNWGSGEDIPTQAVIPVVGLVARECIEEFTVLQQIMQSLMINEGRYKRQLKALEYNYYVPLTDFEYY